MLRRVLWPIVPLIWAWGCRELYDVNRNFPLDLIIAWAFSCEVLYLAGVQVIDTSKLRIWAWSFLLGDYEICFSLLITCPLIYCLGMHRFSGIIGSEWELSPMSSSWAILSHLLRSLNLAFLQVKRISQDEVETLGHVTVCRRLPIKVCEYWLTKK